LCQIRFRRGIWQSGIAVWQFDGAGRGSVGAGPGISRESRVPNRLGFDGHPGERNPPAFRGPEGGVAVSPGFDGLNGLRANEGWKSEIRLPEYRFRAPSGLREMHRLPPSKRPPRSGRCPEKGPQCAAGPLSGPSAGGPDDGGDGDAGMVGSRTAVRPLFHGGGQPAVVSRGRGKPRP